MRNLVSRELRVRSLSCYNFKMLQVCRKEARYIALVPRSFIRIFSGMVIGSHAEALREARLQLPSLEEIAIVDSIKGKQPSLLFSSGDIRRVIAPHHRQHNGALKGETGP